MKRLYIIIFLFLLSTSCNNNKVKLSKEELTRYNTTIQQLEEIETLYDKAVNSLLIFIKSIFPEVIVTRS